MDRHQKFDLIRWLALFLWLVTIASLTSTEQACSEEPATTPRVFETAASILNLSPQEAQHHYPVHLRGVVTWFGVGMTVQDRTAGIWVYLNHPDLLHPGDEVDILGNVDPGLFTPAVRANVIHRLGRTTMPKPRRVNYQQISTGDFDAQFVSVVGTVRFVGDRKTASPFQKVILRVALPGGTIDAFLPAHEAHEANKLLDSLVRIDATVMCQKNQNRQIIAANLAINSLRYVTILRPPLRGASTLRVIPLQNLMQYRSDTDYDHRVRVEGVVTYYDPGEGVYLEDGTSALFAATAEVADVHVGDRIEASGFLAPQKFGPILEDATLKRTGTFSPVQPHSVGMTALTSGKEDNRLVTVTGRLLRRVSEPSREVFVLQDQPQALLLAVLNRTSINDTLPQIREGSRISVTGIDNVKVEGLWNYGGQGEYSLQTTILLRSSGDITEVDPPSWWSLRHLVYIIAALVLIALIFLAKAISGHIKHGRMQAVYAERERLSLEIHDTLAQSFAGIGFQLQAVLKAIPPQLTDLRHLAQIASDLTRHSHKEARRRIEPLQIKIDNGTDLLASLESSARTMVNGGPVEVRAEAIGPSRSLSHRIADTFILIGQEAIANAVRHADPTRLSIYLIYAEETVTLIVEDNGIGFIKSGALLGFGLRGMRTRAAAIKAELEVTTQPQQGTRIVVRAPLPPPDKWRIYGYILRRFKEFTVRYKSEQPHTYSDC